MTHDPWGPLATFSVPIPRARLDRYVAELVHWNQTIRLVGPKDTSGIRLQVIDALLPFLHLLPRFPLLDIGSGAGLPGILLAVLFPDQTVICVEPRLKRVAFLRHVTRLLDLPKVRIIPQRTAEAAERYPDLRQSIVTATARAVADVPWLLREAQPFLVPGGSVLLPRGGGDPIQAPLGWRRTRSVSYDAPNPLGSRSVVEFQLGSG